MKEKTIEKPTPVPVMIVPDPQAQVVPPPSAWSTWFSSPATLVDGALVLFIFVFYLHQKGKLIRYINPTKKILSTNLGYLNEISRNISGILSEISRIRAEKKMILDELPKLRADIDRLDSKLNLLLPTPESIANQIKKAALEVEPDGSKGVVDLALNDLKREKLSWL